jgi:ABC-type branched-subunit amino acid transport system permease subunit
LAALITVVVAAPLFGLVLSVLAGRLAHVSTAQREVATVGVLLVIQGVIQLRFGVTPLNLNTSLPITSVELAGVNVGYDQMITVAIAVVGVLLLGGLFRFTRTGLEMQAVVDNPLLLDLTGQAPGQVRARSWMIGSAFAATSGILLAPTVGLDALVLTLIVVQAFGAAAVGRFERLGTTFVAAVAIGVVQNLLNAPRVQDVLPFVRDLPGIDQAVPFLVLFAVLVFTRSGTFNDRAVPRIPRVASRLPTRLKVAALLTATGAVIVLPVVADTRLAVLTLGAVFVTIYASLFLLVEVSNQVSLCHVAFVAFGAVTFCHLTQGQGFPWVVGVIGAGLVAVPAGAIVAIPAIRLSGLFLALATFGFGILVEKLLYPREVMFGKSGTLRGSRPDVFGLAGDRGYFYLCALAAVAAIALVLLIGRGRLGRLLNGLADSPIALATHGLTTNVTRVLVFCISAGIAGVAGALYVGVVGFVSSVGASPAALVSFNSLVWLVTLSFVGRRPAVSPLLGALALVVGPSFMTSPNTSEYLTIGFGLIAVVTATYGEAILTWMADATPRGRERQARTPVKIRTDERRLEVARG